MGSRDRKLPAHLKKQGANRLQKRETPVSTLQVGCLVKVVTELINQIGNRKKCKRWSSSYSSERIEWLSQKSESSTQFDFPLS